jgi:hypothetical protein
MPISLNIPYLSYDEIGKIAYGLLCKYKYGLIIPVPIEYLIEFDLNINICLIEGLIRSFEIEGWTTSDMSTIQMDAHIYTRREQKARCILAHELGHIILHKDIFNKYQFHSTDQWKKFYINVSDKSYAWLESQAQNFAGLILVPKIHLEAEFNKLVDEHKQRFKEAKDNEIPKDAYEDYFMDIASTRLADIFNVTKEKIVRRIEKGDLKKLIP